MIVNWLQVGIWAWVTVFVSVRPVTERWPVRDVLRQLEEAKEDKQSKMDLIGQLKTSRILNSINGPELFYSPASTARCGSCEDLAEFMPKLPCHVGRKAGSRDKLCMPHTPLKVWLAFQLLPFPVIPAALLHFRNSAPSHVAAEILSEQLLQQKMRWCSGF